MEAFVAFARGRTAQCRTHTERGLFQRKWLKAAFLQSLLLSLTFTHSFTFLMSLALTRSLSKSFPPP